MKTLLCGAVVAALACGLAAPAAAASFTAGNLVVYRVGNGSAALSNASTAVFLDEFTPSGTLVQSVPLPTAASGAQRALTASGTATSEGLLTRSADSRWLVATGYDAAPGTASVASTASTSVNRVIARIGSDGAVDTSTALTDFASGNNIRGATSAGSGAFWVTGATGGVRYVSLGATTSLQLSTDAANLRQPAIFAGQLYVSTSSGSTLRIGAVGSGLPTTAGQSIVNLPGFPLAGSPYCYALLDLDGAPGVDTLYVADDTPGTIVKYALVGGTWTAKGSITAAGARGLVAYAVGSSATLFVTTSANTLSRLTDASGPTGTLTGTLTPLANAATNTVFRGVAFAPTPNTAPVITGLPAAWSGVIGDPTDPVPNSGLPFRVTDDATPAAGLTVTAHSLNPAVLPDSALHVDADANQWYLRIAPTAVGYATIVVTATDAESTSTTASLAYAASQPGAAPGSIGTIWPIGSADASAAVAFGTNMLVGDDETQTLRLFSRSASGAAVATADVAPALALTDVDGGTGLLREVDIEAATRSGNRVLWIGSHGNSKSGKLRPNRNRLFATDVAGSGAGTTVAVVGHYDYLRADLIAWDHGNAHGRGADHYGFAAGSANGVAPEVPDGSGFNIEGMSFAPGSSEAGYVAFRAPIVPATARTRALVVPVDNLGSLAASAGGGSAGSAQFGAPIEFDLGGRGVRDITCSVGGCLIIAGPVADAGDFKLYTWTGNAADAPLERAADLTGLNPEAIVEIPDTALTAAGVVELLSDSGDVVYYADGTIAKDLAQANQRKFRADKVVLGAVVDRTPDAFAFTAQDAVQRGATVVSSDVVLDGFTVALPIAVGACDVGPCEYALNGGNYTSTPGTAHSGDRVTVRLTAANAYATARTLRLDVGGASATFGVTTVGAPAAVVAYAGDGQSTDVGTPFAAPLVVQVRDAAQHPVAGVDVVFQAPTQGAAATFGLASSTTTTTGADGRASSGTLAANALPGSYAVQASVGGISAASFTLTNVGAQLELGAASIDFGAQPYRTRSAPQTLSLRNSGNAALALGGIAAGGDYALQSACSGSLAPGAQCDLTLRFTPTALGARAGQLSVHSGAADTATDVSLTGTGVADQVDLHVALTTAHADLFPLDAARFRLVLGNSGVDPAFGASLSDVFPSGYDSCQWISQASANAAGNTAGPVSGNIAEAALDLGPGASIAYDVQCVVPAAPTAGDVVQTATVTLPATAADMHPGDETSGVTNRIVTDLIYRDGFDGL